MSDPERLPGPRDVRTSLDGDGSDAVVVACPPHPQFGGDRHDRRLRAVGEALADRGIDCLRIDYGAWDEGRGERTDALGALEWGRGEYDHVGLFGYSFGGAVALAAAVEADPQTAPEAISVLAPAADSVAGFDPDDVAQISAPGQLVYGERDDTAAYQPVLRRAESLGWTVEALPADHFFVSQQSRVGDLVAAFVESTLA